MITNNLSYVIDCVVTVHESPVRRSSRATATPGGGHAQLQQGGFHTDINTCDTPIKINK